MFCLWLPLTLGGFLSTKCKCVKSVCAFHLLKWLIKSTNDFSFTGQQQGQDGVKVQQATIAPVTVAVGGIANAAIGAVSPDQITQVQLQQAQQASDQEVQPGKRLRRVACSCPNCREGEGR